MKFGWRAKSVFAFFCVGLFFLTSEVSRAQEFTEAQVLGLYEEYLYYPHEPAKLEQCRKEVLQEFRAVMRRSAGDLESSRNPGRNPDSNCLDRHSRFSAPASVTADRTDRGPFGGIGVLIELKEGSVQVIGVEAGSPAHGAGIKKGDVLVDARNERETVARPIRTIQEATEALRGPPGSKVFITVLRDGRRITLPPMIRKLLVRKTVEYRTLEEGFGYVKVNTFQESTFREFRTAFASFQKNEGNSCVLMDLRNNPGGFLIPSLEMLYSLSADVNDVLLTTRENIGEPSSVTVLQARESFSGLRGIPPGEFGKYKIVLLVNGMSASASEVVAGTLKDWGERRGNIALVGENTFGKGVGQTVSPLLNGGEFVLTTFEFYVGNDSAPVHGRGVAPTYVVSDAGNPEELSAIESVGSDGQLHVGLRVLSELCAQPTR